MIAKTRWQSPRLRDEQINLLEAQTQLRFFRPAEGGGGKFGAVVETRG